MVKLKNRIYQASKTLRKKIEGLLPDNLDPSNLYLALNSGFLQFLQSHLTDLSTRLQNLSSILNEKNSGISFGYENGEFNWNQEIFSEEFLQYSIQQNYIFYYKKTPPKKAIDSFNSNLTDFYKNHQYYKDGISSPNSISIELTEFIESSPLDLYRCCMSQYYFKNDFLNQFFSFLVEKPSRHFINFFKLLLFRHFCQNREIQGILILSSFNNPDNRLKFRAEFPCCNFDYFLLTNISELLVPGKSNSLPEIDWDIPDEVRETFPHLVKSPENSLTLDSVMDSLYLWYKSADMVPAPVNFPYMEILFNRKIENVNQYLEKMDSGEIDTLSYTDLYRMAITFSLLESAEESELLKSYFQQSKENKNYIENDFYVRRRKKLVFQLVHSPKPSVGLELLERSGILKYTFSELSNAKDLGQNRFHKYDIFYHSVYTCDFSMGYPIHIRFASLFHDLGKVETRRILDGSEASFHNHEYVSAKHASRILRRFVFEDDFIKKVKFLIINHMFHYTNDWTDKTVRRFLRKISREELRELILLRLADRKGSGKKAKIPTAIYNLILHIDEVIEQDKQLKITDLTVNGNDLRDIFKLDPGPIFGDALRYLLQIVKADQSLNERKILLAELEKFFKNSENKQLN